MKPNSSLHYEYGASIDACQRAPHQTNHFQQIFDMLPDQKKRSLPTHDSLIELIIRTRNRLHHFSNDPKKVHGSPLNHAKYEGIAVLVRFLAHTGLVKRALEIKGVSHVLLNELTNLAVSVKLRSRKPCK